ncbi:MAG: hypothetical protein U5K43_04615 [Halofilum sp. (in: g-proteobacteria)]|nr:hypothetical protein [Halofilum sp. (in: g-proteobacteria)]
MQMELDLPPRDPPSRSGFAATRGGIRRWLKELGRLEVREATRRFTEGVRTLNRTEIPARTRVRIMERLRPMGREVLDHLAGRVHAQSLPLPERTRRVFELNLDLLRELALGYEIVLAAETGGSSPGAARRIALAAERALAARGEMMLRAAQVYAPLHEAFWRQTHAVYALAEAAGAADRPVPDAELVQGGRRRQSVRTMYKRLLLFAVAQTDGLRKADSERIYRALEDWAALASLHAADQAEAAGDDGDCRFAVDLAATAAPLAWRLFAHAPAPTVRVLELARVLATVEDLLERAQALGADEVVRSRPHQRGRPAPARRPLAGAGRAPGRARGAWRARRGGAHAAAHPRAPGAAGARARGGAGGRAPPRQRRRQPRPADDRARRRAAGRALHHAPGHRRGQRRGQGLGRRRRGAGARTRPGTGARAGRARGDRAQGAPGPALLAARGQQPDRLPAALGRRGGVARDRRRADRAAPRRR